MGTCSEVATFVEGGVHASEFMVNQEQRKGYSPSRVVCSGQNGPHVDLERVVRRHLATVFSRPVGEATREAYCRFFGRWDALGRPPLVFDSGCGVGESTRRLAEQFPVALVVGIDKSEDRLGRGVAGGRFDPFPENACLVRADLVDFWRLAVSDGLHLMAHYLLYPNPWPKSGHLQRRWHGHAVFPSLLALGGRLEIRSNWRLYIEEFVQAVVLAKTMGSSTAPASIEVIPASELSRPMTPFERKYHLSGQALYRAVVSL